MAVEPATAGSYRYVSLDIPGSRQTAPSALNRNDQIVGGVSFAPDRTRGFVYSGGVFTVVNGPGPSSDLALTGLNDAGVAVGISDRHCVRYELASAKTSLIEPGKLLECVGISNRGSIVGNFDQSAGGGAFLREPGVTTNIGLTTDFFDQVVGINSDDEVLMWTGDGFDVYLDGRHTVVKTRLSIGGIAQDGKVFGGQFVYANEMFRTVQYPNAAFTKVTGLNGRGITVGYYAHKGNTAVHSGFVKIGEVFHGLDFPGALSTSVRAVNVNATLIGEYLDTNLSYHGFVAFCDADQAPCTQ